MEMLNSKQPVVTHVIFIDEFIYFLKLQNSVDLENIFNIYLTIQIKIAQLEIKKWKVIQQNTLITLSLNY